MIFQEDLLRIDTPLHSARCTVSRMDSGAGKTPRGVRESFASGLYAPDTLGAFASIFEDPDFREKSKDFQGKTLKILDFHLNFTGTPGSGIQASRSCSGGRSQRASGPGGPPGRPRRPVGQGQPGGPPGTAGNTRHGFGMLPPPYRTHFGIWLALRTSVKTSEPKSFTADMLTQGLRRK